MPGRPCSFGAWFAAVVLPMLLVAYAAGYYVTVSRIDQGGMLAPRYSVPVALSTEGASRVNGGLTRLFAAVHFFDRRVRPRVWCGNGGHFSDSPTFEVLRTDMGRKDRAAGLVLPEADLPLPADELVTRARFHDPIRSGVSP